MVNGEYMYVHFVIYLLEMAFLGLINIGTFKIDVIIK